MPLTKNECRTKLTTWLTDNRLVAQSRKGHKGSWGMAWGEDAAKAVIAYLAKRYEACFSGDKTFDKNKLVLFLQDLNFFLYRQLGEIESTSFGNCIVNSYPVLFDLQKSILEKAQFDAEQFKQVRSDLEHIFQDFIFCCSHTSCTGTWEKASNLRMFFSFKQFDEKSITSVPAPSSAVASSFSPATFLSPSVDNKDSKITSVQFDSKKSDAAVLAQANAKLNAYLAARSSMCFEATNLYKTQAVNRLKYRINLCNTKEDYLFLLTVIMDTAYMDVDRDKSGEKFRKCLKELFILILDSANLTTEMAKELFDYIARDRRSGPDYIGDPKYVEDYYQAYADWLEKNPGNTLDVIMHIFKRPGYGYPQRYKGYVDKMIAGAQQSQIPLGSANEVIQAYNDMLPKFRRSHKRMNYLKSQSLRLSRVE